MGGAERAFVNLYNELKESHNISICVFTAKGTAFDIDRETLELDSFSANTVIGKSWNYIMRIIRLIF